MLKYLILCCNVLATNTAGKDSQLDDQTFLIYNKAHAYSRLKVMKENKDNMGLYTTETNKVGEGECWYIRPEPNSPGYHYIESCVFDGYRLAHWDWYTFLKGNVRSFGVRNGNRDDTMLFKITAMGKFYRISSKKYPEYNLAKVGTYDSDLEMSDGPLRDNQLWRFDARFKTSIQKDVLWHVDNRAGSNDFS